MYLSVPGASKPALYASSPSCMDLILDEALVIELCFGCRCAYALEASLPASHSRSSLLQWFCIPVCQEMIVSGEGPQLDEVPFSLDLFLGMRGKEHRMYLTLLRLCIPIFSSHRGFALWKKCTPSVGDLTSSCPKGTGYRSRKTGRTLSFDKCKNLLRRVVECRTATEELITL